MSHPVPLAAPDGVVYAYACGRCHRAWAWVGDHGDNPVQDITAQAAESLATARRCCVCHVCKHVVEDDRRGKIQCGRCVAAMEAREKTIAPYGWCKEEDANHPVPCWSVATHAVEAPDGRRDGDVYCEEHARKHWAVCCGEEGWRVVALCELADRAGEP